MSQDHLGGAAKAAECTFPYLVEPLVVVPGIREALRANCVAPWSGGNSAHANTFYVGKGEHDQHLRPGPPRKLTTESSALLDTNREGERQVTTTCKHRVHQPKGSSTHHELAPSQRLFR